MTLSFPSPFFSHNIEVINLEVISLTITCCHVLHTGSLTITVSSLLLITILTFLLSPPPFTSQQLSLAQRRPSWLWMKPTERRAGAHLLFWQSLTSSKRPLACSPVSAIPLEDAVCFLLLWTEKLKLGNIFSDTVHSNRRVTCVFYLMRGICPLP